MPNIMDFLSVLFKTRALLMAQQLKKNNILVSNGIMLSLIILVTLLEIIEIRKKKSYWNLSYNEIKKMQQIII